MKPVALVAAAALLAAACTPAADASPADVVSGAEATAASSASAPQGGPGSVFIEELTWTEIQEKIDNGATTAIVPTAGTEQNGPHMVMGKHRYIIEHASDLIARELGNALVAPTMTYVPEGSIDPPSGHMNFAGTISLPNEVFMQVLEATARSLRAHGFTNIAFIGDSGGNQRGMSAVADMLNEEWADEETRVLFIGTTTRPTGSASGWNRRARRKRPSEVTRGSPTPRS